MLRMLVGLSIKARYTVSQTHSRRKGVRIHTICSTVKLTILSPFDANYKLSGCF